MKPQQAEQFIELLEEFVVAKIEFETEYEKYRDNERMFPQHSFDQLKGLKERLTYALTSPE